MKGDFNGKIGLLEIENDKRIKYENVEFLDVLAILKNLHGICLPLSKNYKKEFNLKENENLSLLHVKDDQFYQTYQNVLDFKFELAKPCRFILSSEFESESRYHFDKILFFLAQNPFFDCTFKL